MLGLVDLERVQNNADYDNNIIDFSVPDRNGVG